MSTGLFFQQGIIKLLVVMPRSSPASPSRNWLPHYAHGEMTQDRNGGKWVNVDSYSITFTVQWNWFHLTIPIQYENKSCVFETQCKISRVPCGPNRIEIIYVKLWLHMSCQKMIFMAILVDRFFFKKKQKVIKRSFVLFDFVFNTRQL